MKIFFQLAVLILVVRAGPAVIVLLAARKGNLLFSMNIEINQVFVALFIALFTGTVAIRLGVELYKLLIFFFYYYFK